MNTYREVEKHLKTALWHIKNANRFTPAEVNSLEKQFKGLSKSFLSIIEKEAKEEPKKAVKKEGK